MIAGAIVVAAAIGGVTILMMSNKGGGSSETNPVKPPDPNTNTPTPPTPTPKPPDPVPDMAKVTLQTTPPGAEIFVENVDQNAKTPSSIQLPRGKAVKISFKLDGYLPIEREEPIDQPTVNYDFTLTPKEAPKPPEGSDAGVGTGSNTTTPPPVDHTSHTTPPPVDHTTHTTPQNHTTPPQNHTTPQQQQNQNHTPPPPPHTGSNTQQTHHDTDGVMKPGDI